MGVNVPKHRENGSFFFVKLVIDPNVTLYRLKYVNAEVIHASALVASEIIGSISFILQDK